MDAPADDNGAAAPADDRDLVSRAIALLGLRVDDARSLLDEATARWRGDAVRIGEGGRQRLKDVFRELGIVTREDWDELELRVAQIEHRLRLLEDRET
jgi:polyhydroxyalkanoate synthesis regulator phasin